MDSDQPDVSLRDVSIALQDIQGFLKSSFKYTMSNNVHRVSDINGWVVDEIDGKSTITLNITGRLAVDLFNKMQTKFPNSIKLTRQSGVFGTRSYLIEERDYLVGDYNAFITAYNDIFLWHKYSKEFETALEDELSKKPE